MNSRYYHIVFSALPMVVFMLCGTLQAQQGTVFSDYPIDIHYNVNNSTTNGQLLVKATMLNGTHLGNNKFDLEGLGTARMQLSITVNLKRTGPKHLAKRISFASNAFNQLDDNDWKLTDSRRVYQIAHGETLKLNFEHRTNQRVHFYLPFVVVDAGDTNSDAWDFSPKTNHRNAILLTTVDLTGIADADDRSWAQNNRNLDGWLNYLRAFPSGKYQRDAHERIENQVDKDFASLVTNTPETDTDSPQRFINTYQDYNGQHPVITSRLGSALKALENRGREPEPLPVVEAKPPPVNQELVDFNAAKASGDTSELLAYLEKYGPYAKFESEAQDSLLNWRPVFFRILSSTNGRTMLQVFNFKAPVIRDIYRGVLDIDYSQLEDQHLLEVRPLREGRITIEIVDRELAGKILSIPLDNLMEAQMSFDSLTGEYTFVFEGGVQPYGLALVDPEGLQAGFQRDSIFTTKLVITRDELDRAGLEGTFTARAFSSGSRQPVNVLGGVVHMPIPPPFQWLIPVLLVIGAGLLVFLVLFLLRRRNYRQQTIFDQG